MASDLPSLTKVALPSYFNYCYTYTLVFLKRSHRCVFRPSGDCQEAKKVAVARKYHQNF